jgi:hypothetical protein
MLGDAAAPASQALAERFAAQYCAAGIPAMAEMVTIAPNLTPERFQAIFAPMMVKGLAEAAGVDERAVRLAFHGAVATGPALVAPAPVAAPVAAPAAAPAAAGGWGAAAPTAAPAAATPAKAAAPAPPPPPSSAAVGWGAAPPAAAPAAAAPAASSPVRRLRLRMLLQAATTTAATAAPQYTTAAPPLLVSARITGAGAADALRAAASRDGGKAFYDALSSAGFGYKPSLKLGDDANPVLKGEPRYVRGAEPPAAAPAPSASARKSGLGGPAMPWWKALAIALGVIFGTLLLLAAIFACCLVSKKRRSREIRKRHEEQLAQSLMRTNAAAGSSPRGSSASGETAVGKQPVAAAAPRYSDDASFARDVSAAPAAAATATEAAATEAAATTTTANPLAAAAAAQ